MGQMGEELLLSGKRVLPRKALDAGYIFKYKALQDALINVV
jgi:NAD dependent epimerase/dehydratase family enzyme